jgi:cation transport ATPase
MSPQGIEQIHVEQVAVGDRLLVGAGERSCRSTAGSVTRACSTNRRCPAKRTRSTAGPATTSAAAVVNAGSATTMTATRTAAESTYAGVVRLVEHAQADSAPFVRLADRYAIAFVPFTLVVAGLAWAVTGDAVRAVAVARGRHAVPAVVGRTRSRSCPDCPARPGTA